MFSSDLFPGLDNDIQGIFEKIIAGDRAVLGQAMTLIESERAEDRLKAIGLLELCERNPADTNSIRLTISGAPGVGKSTLLETIGQKAISEGNKVGIITVDPSSQISSGSILGDKARMPVLSISPSAFIRSSPAGKLLGGIGRRSKELMSLLTAAGYNYIFLETVGVGQSEHVAWQLTDGFILVIQPGGGDEIQGIKRGITELADIILVNKADGEMQGAAAIARSQYQNAIHYMSPLRENWTPKILTCSATTSEGINEFWEVLRLYKEERLQPAVILAERQRQQAYWLSWSLGITAHELLMEHPVVNQKLQEGLVHIKQHHKSLFRTAMEIEQTMRSIIENKTPLQTDTKI